MLSLSVSCLRLGAKAMTRMSLDLERELFAALYRGDADLIGQDVGKGWVWLFFRINDADLFFLHRVGSE